MLDAASLAAITQEARTCFLYEDAPDYLAALNRELQAWIDSADPDCTPLLRTVHSLKGGAGIAQLPSLSRVAHHLEDLLEALQQGCVKDRSTAKQLLLDGVTVVGQMISASQRQIPLPPSLLESRLDDFLATQVTRTEPPELSSDLGPAEPGESPAAAPPGSLLHTALTVDLEDCLQRVEAALPTPTLPKALAGLIEECSLLGEALNQPWLIGAITPLRPFTASGLSPRDQQAAQAIATQVLGQIRQQRETLLKPTPPTSLPPTPVPSAPVPSAPTPISTRDPSDASFPSPRSLPQPPSTGHPPQPHDQHPGRTADQPRAPQPLPNPTQPH